MEFKYSIWWSETNLGLWKLQYSQTGSHVIWFEFTEFSKKYASSISFPLKVSLIYDSEKPVSFYKTTRSLIQEDINVHRA